MTVSGRGRVDRARSRPTITARIVSSARVQIGFAVATKSTPDNHFRTCPDCRVTVSAFGRAGGVSGYPTLRARIVSATGVEKVVGITVILIKGPAPDNHFSAAPHCGVRNASIGRVVGGRVYPSVGNGIVSPPCIQKAGVSTLPTPDNHFSASPNCRVLVSRNGRVDGACSRPTVAFWIVSPAVVYKPVKIDSTPDDHFAAGPDCRMGVSGRRRIDNAGGYPIVRDRIVSPACIQKGATIIAVSAPDDHLTTGPNPSGTSPTSGRIGNARS